MDKPLRQTGIQATKNWLKQNWILLIILGLLIAPSIIYYEKLSVQSYVEYFVPNASKSIKALFYAWQPSNFGTNGSGSMWRIFPLSAYYSLFTLLHLSPQVAQAVFLAGIRLIGFFGFVAFIKLFYRPNVPHQKAILLAGLLFVYNPYTLNYFASSYIALLPYYLLPLQAYLFTKALQSARWRNWFAPIVILAVVNSTCFGVNLVYDVIAVVALCLIALFHYLRKEASFMKIAGILLAAGLLTSLLIVWWILPMLASSTADKETSNFILTSESFYNQDSSPLRLLQGLGEWGFFSGYKGELYHNFAGWYGESPLIFVANLAMIGLFLWALLISSAEKNRRSKILLVFTSFFVILLIPFIGGTNKDWPTAGLMDWAFRTIPYFGAMRNTYKWMSLVMLLECVVIVYGLHSLFVRKRFQRLRKYVGPVFLSLIALGTAPLWLGNIYEQDTLAMPTPSYWNQAVAYMNQNESGKDSRTLLLPNQYFSVYQWTRPGAHQTERVGFPDSLEARIFKGTVVQNMCKGCGQYNTLQLLDFMYTNPREPNLSRLMGMANVTAILQRNDYDYKYYDVESPAEIKDIAAKQGLNLRKQFGKLDLYDLPKGTVYPRIYSPSNVVATNDLRSSLDLFNEYNTSNNSTAFILDGGTAKSDLSGKIPSNFYSRAYNNEKLKFTGTQAISSINIESNAYYNVVKNKPDGKLQSSFKIVYRYVGNGYRLRFENIDGAVTIDGKSALKPALNDDNSITYNIEAVKRPLAVRIEGKAYYLLPSESEQLLDTRNLLTGLKNPIVIESLAANDGRNLMANPSFESGAWNKQVGNCTQLTKNADLQGSVINGQGTDGQKALRLTASDDTACEYSSAISNFKPGSSYLVSFDYRSLKGAAPAICVWDGRRCLSYENLNNSQLTNSSSVKGWTTERQVVVTRPDSSQLLVYVYAPKGNYPVTEALFDNFNVNSLESVSSDLKGSVVLDGSFDKHQSVKVNSKQAVVSTQIVRDDRNLVGNGSFESGAWVRKANNCQEVVPTARVSQSISKDASNGEQSLELYGDAGSACVSSSMINDVDTEHDYILSLDYKVLNGDSAQFCIWNGKECLKQMELPAKNRQWQQYQVGFTPSKAGESLSIYLYAQTKNGVSKVRYDNIQITRIENKVLGSYSLKKAGSAELQPMKLNYSRDDPTHYTVNIEQINKGMIVLQESYQPLWRGVLTATAANGSKLAWQVPDSDHKIVNGYANAWLLDPARLPAGFKDARDIKLTASFTPQHYFYVGVIVSGAAFGLCLVYIAWYYGRPLLAGHVGKKPVKKPGKRLYRVRR